MADEQRAERRHLCLPRSANQSGVDPQLGNPSPPSTHRLRAIPSPVESDPAPGGRPGLGMHFLSKRGGWICNQQWPVPRSLVVAMTPHQKA